MGELHDRSVAIVYRSHIFRGSFDIISVFSSTLRLCKLPRGDSSVEQFVNLSECSSSEVRDRKPDKHAADQTQSEEDEGGLDTQFGAGVSAQQVWQNDSWKATRININCYLRYRLHFALTHNQSSDGVSHGSQRGSLASKSTRPRLSGVCPARYSRSKSRGRKEQCSKDHQKSSGCCVKVGATYDVNEAERKHAQSHSADTSKK